LNSGFERTKFELRNRGPWTVLSVRDWPRFTVGQTTALGGGASPSLNQPDARLAFYKHFNVQSFHEAQQVHGRQLATTGRYSAGYPYTDGLFASVPRRLLTIRTADCYPVFFRERRSGRFGVVHAGWRGLREGIVRNALERWFSRPVDLLLGSAIGADHYPVGADVRAALSKAFDTPESDLRKAGVFLEENLNLPRAIQFQAEHAEGTVSTYRRLPPSTSEDLPPMLSYRADGTEDRMVSWIARCDP
jgi:copper oxidase (laccase) domain-containing protein